MAKKLSPEWARGSRGGRGSLDSILRHVSWYVGTHSRSKIQTRSLPPTRSPPLSPDHNILWSTPEHRRQLDPARIPLTIGQRVCVCANLSSAPTADPKPTGEKPDDRVRKTLTSDFPDKEVRKKEDDNQATGDVDSPKPRSTECTT